MFGVLQKLLTSLLPLLTGFFKRHTTFCINWTAACTDALNDGQTFDLQFLVPSQFQNEWPWNIVWIDDTHFNLDRSANTHNCSILASENPYKCLQIPLHSFLQTRRCVPTTVFIQDGVPPHTTHCMKQILRFQFTEGAIISRHFLMAWNSILAIFSCEATSKIHPLGFQNITLWP